MTPQEIQNLLNRLQTVYTALNETNPFAGMDPAVIAQSTSEVQRLNDQLAGVEQRLRDQTNDLDTIYGAFRGITNEVKKGNVALTQANSTFKGLTSLSQKLRDDQAGITQLSEKELVSIRAKIQSKLKDLEIDKRILENKRAELAAAGATNDELAKYDIAIQNVNEELTGSNSLTNSLLQATEERIKAEKKLQEAMGLTGGAIGGIDGALKQLGIGGLSKQLGLEEAQSRMRKIATEVTNGGTQTADFAGKMKILKGGVSSMGQSLLTNLKDPLSQATFFIDQLFKALKGSDAAASDMAKGLNMSYKEALATRRELTAMASATGNNFVNTRGMQESYMAINKTLGTSVMLNEKMLVQFTEMREMAGFTNEELQGIAAISITTGKEMNDVTGEFMAQAKISALQNGVLLNEKDLLKDIGKISAATTLSFSKDPKLIGEAVATAKSLGMELSKVDDIANSLLNFEESIANELEAELLLGKDINLEKARLAALNNDLATVAKEISDQTGSSAEFAKMNRIQQEALAKSVGMNREDLAKTLFVQEQLAGLTGDAAKEQEELLNKRIEEVGLAQAQKELAKGGIEGLREQAGLADKFNATMEKVQELFVMIADPILVIVDAFSPILEIVGALVGLIGELGKGASYFGELLTEWTSGLGIIGSLLRGLGYAMVLIAGYGAYAALSPIPVVGPVLGAAAAAAIITGGFSAINSSPKKVGDVMSPASGKTMVSTKEGGLFELSKNDDLIAAPGAVDRMKNGGSTTVVQQAPPPDNTETKRSNMLLEKIANQSPVFKIGTDEFFTSTSKYSYQVQ
jgi:hypothetical protein